MYAEGSSSSIAGLSFVHVFYHEKTKCDELILVKKVYILVTAKASRIRNKPTLISANTLI
jgi:hypothetical protein